MCQRYLPLSPALPVYMLMLVQEDDKEFPVKLSDESFETYELDPPPYELHTTKKELKQMYYDMVSVRYVIDWHTRGWAGH